MSKEVEIESPCVGVCTLDETTGFCLGCYRSADEIKNWWDKTNAEKIAVLKQLEVRVEQSFD
ncbi:MAG: DUF1289 domain-containing protein [Methylotenera sp.]